MRWWFPFPLFKFYIGDGQGGYHKKTRFKLGFSVFEGSIEQIIAVSFFGLDPFGYMPSNMHSYVFVLVPK